MDNINRLQHTLKKTEAFARQIVIKKMKEKSGRRASLSPQVALAALGNGLLLQPTFDYLELIMRKCMTEKELALVLILHAYIHEEGLETHASLGNYLVCMFVESNSMHDAQKVFDLLLARHEYTWNSLIHAYVECGDSRQAFSLYQKMRDNSLQPSGHAFVSLLKACANLKDLERGSAMYTDITHQGLLLNDVYIGSTLVDMFVKCGLLAKAHKVFDNLPVRNVISWNALISGYAKYEQGEGALNCFEQMQLEGITPNAVTFICCLKACGNIGAIEKGCQIHYEILKNDLLNKHHVLGSALVDMYAKCGMLSKAQEVFDKLLVRNVISWNALIGGYAKHDCGKEALKCFEQMQSEGVSPDSITFTSSLKACTSIRALHKGSEIHAEIDKQGLLRKDHVLGSALVDMYAKCGMLEKALDISKSLAFRDVFLWTALIAGYTEHERSEEALECFERMQSEGIPPDAITFACCLKACGSIGATSEGREIHADLERRNMLRNHLNVGNALVDMYTKFGPIARAEEVFNRLPKRDIVSWNTLIGGYTNHEHGEKALLCLERMRRDFVSPDAVTYTCSLKACGSIIAIDEGKEIHIEVEKSGLLGKDVAIGNALIAMYAKCGLLTKAREVFDNIPNRDLVTWNTLIAGYAKLGESEDVFVVFERMKDDGTKPDSATFACVFNACNHTGLSEKAETYFNSMVYDYGITPTAEHFTCIVDLLGRAGQLDKSLAMMMKVPLLPDIAMWYIVLCACRKWGNVELGKEAFEQALRLDEKESMVYICMYNIYADANMQEAAKKVQEMRVQKQTMMK